MFLMLHSRLGLGQRLLLTDIYKLDNAQVSNIYILCPSRENQAGMGLEKNRKISCH